MDCDVRAVLEERRGHFVFESGHHGRVWLDLERLYLHPERLRPLAAALAARLEAHRPEVVCGPLIEGAFVALQVASVLGLPFTYSTPTPDTRAETGALFPIAYPIPDVLHRELRGRRVAVVNDVINAGSAVRGTLGSLRACGARCAVIGALAVYGEAAAELAAGHEAALEPLASFPSQIWEPEKCPMCERGEALTNAGGDAA